MMKPNCLKVMTYNIRYGTAEDGDNHWRHRGPSLLQLIREEAPDILGVQEALRFQIDEILAAMPYYRFVGVGRDDGREAGEHAAIFYDSRKFIVDNTQTRWLSETPTLPGSISWGNECARICTDALFTRKENPTQFHVYNLHLDHRSAEGRLHGIQMVLEDAKEHPEPTILMGDFNVGETDSVIQLVRAAGLIDAFRIIYPTCLAPTFGAFQEPTGERIDYIFASPELQITNAEILSRKINGRYPSDHAPVLCDVSL